MKVTKSALDDQCLRELYNLLEHFDHNLTRVGAELGYTKQAVSLWLKAGKISKKGAIQAERYNAKLFQKETLRPDLF